MSIPRKVGRSVPARANIPRTDAIREPRARKESGGVSDRGERCDASPESLVRIGRTGVEDSLGAGHRMAPGLLGRLSPRWRSHPTPKPGAGPPNCGGPGISRTGPPIRASVSAFARRSAASRSPLANGRPARPREGESVTLDTVERGVAHLDGGRTCGSRVGPDTAARERKPRARPAGARPTKRPRTRARRRSGAFRKRPASPGRGKRAYSVIS